MIKERRTQESAETLTIRLFGAFSIQRNGTEAPRARTRKEQSLLGLLLLRHGSALDRDWLAGVLWPNSGERQALYNLRRSLSNLREILGADTLRLSSPTPRSVRLDTVGAEVDVLAFDSAIVQDTEASLERAVALYRGPLLEGFDEAWIVPERESREQSYLRALETLAADALDRQDTATAVRHLRTVIQADPLRETAQRALLAALLAQDDLASATDAYYRFRLLLHRELHTEPAPETAAVYEQVKARLRSADGSARLAAVQHALSPRVPRLISSRVGRDTEIEAIKDTLQAARLLTLTGTGGIGKTRLALEVVEQVAERYSDGVWFVALAEIDDPERVVTFVASTRGLAEEREHGPLEAVCHFLEKRSLLLVLDNCEHLIEACAKFVETLLQNCPYLTVLATSRQSLGAAGEHIRLVPPLSLPVSKTSSTSPANDLYLAQSESEALFQERARQVAPEFRITSKNRGAVAKICRLTGGIPFAIELAAAWIRTLPVEQLSARLTKQLLMLAGNRRTSRPHQQTLRATLDWSYRLLSEEEKRLLCRLSVFAGGCSLEAAEAVCEKAAAAQSDILGLLDRLVDKSLVVFSDDEDGTRYRLLEMTRVYADEQLSSEERQSARRQHAAYFLSLAESSLEAEDRWNLSAAWYRQIAREYENLHGALLWLETQAAGLSDGLRLAAVLWRCWTHSSHLSEGGAILTRLLAKSASVSAVSVSLERGRALYGAGVLAADQSDYALAATRFEEALQICRQLGRPREEADCLLQLGVIARDRGETLQAQTLLNWSYTVRSGLSDPGDITPTLIGRGNIACDQGDYARARTHYTESLESSQRAGKSLAIAFALRALGGLAYQQGNYDEAETWYARCRDIFQGLEHRWGVAYACNRMATIAALRNDFPEARRLIEESMLIWQEARDRWGATLATISLGLTASLEGDLDKAQMLYTESLTVAHRLGNRGEVCQLLERLGSLAACQQHWERAVVILAAAETERERLGLSVPHLEQRLRTEALTQIRAAIDDSTFLRWHGIGTHYTIDEAIKKNLGEAS